MTDQDLLRDAKTLLENFFQAYQTEVGDSLDDRRFQEELGDILSSLDQASDLDNIILIKLYKFYTRASQLVGLSSLKLGGEARELWTTFTTFHSDRIRPAQKIHGPIL